MTPLHLDYPISVAILYYVGDAGDMVDTLESVKGITDALVNRGHVVRTLEVTKKNWRKAVRLPGDVVFNLVEDDGWILYEKVGQRLEEMGRAQMGHDISSFKYIIKKARVKRRMERLGVATPYFKIYNRASKISDVRSLEFPLIVKPSGQHAGIGISQDSVVIDNEELHDRIAYLFKHFPGEVIAEEYVEGREIHITVMGNGRHIFALPYAELEFNGEFADNWNIYTYNAKWEQKTWEYWDARVTSPALLDTKMNKKLERLALKAYRAFNCRDIARFDIRLDDKGRPYIVDVNMNPSLNVHDDQDATIKSIEALGWSYEEFIETLIAITYKRIYGKLPDRTRERSFLLAAPNK
jgi:D-alanine-D-alanine ligase